MGGGLGHFVTFLKTKSYSNICIYFRASWTRERDLRKLSRGIHGINRVKKKKRKKKRKTHFKTKQRP